MLLAWWVSLLERRGLKLLNRLDPLELHKAMAMELKWMLSKVLDQPAKLANRYPFSQEPDLHAVHEEEHISLVIFLWNFCRPVHCGSSAICLLELYTFKEGASKPSG